MRDPVNRLDQLKGLIGDLARPYAVIAVATATSWAVFDGKDAGVITAAGVILAAIYTARGVENAMGSRDAARIEVSKNQHQDPAA